MTCWWEVAREKNTGKISDRKGIGGEDPPRGRVWINQCNKLQGCTVLVEEGVYGRSSGECVASVRKIREVSKVEERKISRAIGRSGKGETMRQPLEYEKTCENDQL